MTDHAPVPSRDPDPPLLSDGDPPEAVGLGGQSTPELLPAREPFRSILHWLGLVEQVLGGALIIVILALVIVQVVQRYLPEGGWAWTGEMARFAMVWTTFVMAGYLMAHDQHVAIKVVDYFLPRRALGLVMAFGHTLIVATCLVMAYATYDFIANDRGQVTAAAQIPLAVIYAVPLLGFLSTALRAGLGVFVLDLPMLRRDRELVR
jgi:TRAP-type C4-dicarboxylate transport system permease small subunit